MILWFLSLEYWKYLLLLLDLVDLLHRAATKICTCQGSYKAALSCLKNTELKLSERNPSTEWYLMIPVFSLFIRIDWGQTQKESKLFSVCQNLKTSKHFKNSWVCSLRPSLLPVSPLSIHQPTPSDNFWKMSSDTGLNRADIPLSLIGNSSCAEMLQPCTSISLRKAWKETVEGKCS